MINPLELVLFFRLGNKIKEANNPKSIYECIQDIENDLGFVKSTLYDNPFFLVKPGTEKKTNEWIDNLIGYGKPDIDELKKFMDAGFVIIDRKLFSDSNLIDMFEPLGFDDNFLLLDKEYGLLVLPEKSKKKNFYLGMSELPRYFEKYPHLRESPSDIFSIGALRAHSLLRGSTGFTPIEIEVTSKDELLGHIGSIQNKLQQHQSRFQIWFRGQTEEYLINEIDNNLIKYCPWRTIRDISLVPSLFRKSEKIQDDLKAYAEKLYQILNYEKALNIHLDVPKYDNRADITDDFRKYFIGTVWEGSNSPIQTTVTNSEGNIIEVHDYNPIYRALQASLFLQHYGIPTNILDITKDLDVALFFAQNNLNNGQYEEITQVNNSVIYLFLLDPKTDRFLDSTEILEAFNVQRPIRQKCGVLAGASYSSQNYYSKFISVKFKIKNSIRYDSNVNTNHLFPKPEQDHILHFLNEHSKKHNLDIVKPL